MDRGRSAKTCEELEPAGPLAEPVDEAEAAGVRERQQGAHEARRAAEDGAGPRGGVRLLERGDVREQRQVLALAAERPIEREGDGLALDQGLAGEDLVTAPGRPEEAVEVHLAVLEEMDQLVGERLALLVAREPVARGP